MNELVEFLVKLPSAVFYSVSLLILMLNLHPKWWKFLKGVINWIKEVLTIYDRVYKLETEFEHHQQVHRGSDEISVGR